MELTSLTFLTDKAADALEPKMADGQVALRAANGVEAVRIDAAGRVGIGTNDPSFTLHANGTNGGIIGISRTSGSTTGTLGILRFGNTAIGGGAGENNLAGINGIQDGATDSAKITFTTQPTGGSTTERMVIKSDGNVGIGTDAPGAQLHIWGANPRIDLTDTDTGCDAYITADSSVGGMSISADGNDEGSAAYLDLKTGNVSRLMLRGTGLHTFSGSVGIGTDGSGGKLQIVQGGAGRKSTFSTSLGLTIQANDNSVPAALNLVNTYAGANYGTTLGYQLGYSGSSSATGELVDAGKITVAATQTWTDVPNTQDSYMTFQTAKNGSLSEHVRINQDGEVGIGTDDPIAQLHISGADTSDQVLIQNSSASSPLRLQIWYWIGLPPLLLVEIILVSFSFVEETVLAEEYQTTHLFYANNC